MTRASDTTDRILAKIKNNKVIAILIVGGVIVLALATTADSVVRLVDFVSRIRGTASEQIRTDDAGPTIALQLDCRTEVLPVQVDARSRIHILGATPSFGNGLIEYLTGDDETLSYLLNPPRFGQLAYRCEMSNLMDSTVVSVSMIFQVGFREVISNGQTAAASGNDIPEYSHTHDVSISRIDGRDTFTFYIINHSEYFATVTLPEEASLEGPDISGRVETRLMPTSKNGGQLVMLPPRPQGEAIRPEEVPQEPEEVPSRTSADAPEEERPSIQIEQRSEGDNSPNTTIIGDNNEVSINPDPTRPVVTYFYNGNQRISQPWLIRDNPDNPAFRAFPAIREASQKHDWNLLLRLTDDAIQETPVWLTPYLYKAEAQANLGHIQEAIELLEFALAEAAGNQDYELLIQQAMELREKIRQGTGR